MPKNAIIREAILNEKRKNIILSKFASRSQSVF
jgi:hypothetical protein